MADISEVGRQGASLGIEETVWEVGSVAVYKVGPVTALKGQERLSRSVMTAH